MPVGGFGEMWWHINAKEERQLPRNNPSEFRSLTDVLIILGTIGGAVAVCVAYVALLAWVFHRPFP